MPNGDMTFEEFMKAYPQFDKTFIKALMGKGLKIRIQPTDTQAQRGRSYTRPSPVYQGMSNTIIIPQHALGDPTVIEHELVHALSDLDPQALKTAGFSGAQRFLGGISPGVSMETPGGVARGLASVIAPKTVSRLSESLAISAAGQEAYPGFKPMGEREQFGFMFRGGALPETMGAAEQSDRVMLQQASRLRRVGYAPRPEPEKPSVPRMRAATTKPAFRRRGGIQEF